MQKRVLCVTSLRAPDEGEYKSNALSLSLNEVQNFDDAASDKLFSSVIIATFTL